MTTNIESEITQLVDAFNLSDDDLSDAAKCQFSFHREILNSLKFCGQSIRDSEHLSLGGKYIICSKLIRSYHNVKNVLNYLASKPLVSKETSNKVPVIIICGLTRTGSTLLHNLMACDPSSRAPVLTDMVMQPIPPIGRSNVEEHKRREKFEAGIEAEIFQTAQCDLQKLRQNFTASHPVFPTDDDALLLADVGVRMMYAILADNKTDFFSWFINQQNKDFAYNYHRTILQMLHDVDPPRTHWQLKGSLHTCFIDTLLKYYPQASIIMSHRRLDEQIPSTYRLFLSYVTTFFNGENMADWKIIYEQGVAKLVDTWIERLVEYRTRQPSQTNIFDIKYEDLMKDPIGTVRRIYEHFDFLQWSNEFEEAMRAWLIENPQGKHGRNSYSLAEFGLEGQMDKQLYKEYEKLFLSK